MKIRKFLFKLSLSKEDKIQIALGTKTCVCPSCKGLGEQFVDHEVFNKVIDGRNEFQEWSIKYRALKVTHWGDYTTFECLQCKNLGVVFSPYIPGDSTATYNDYQYFDKRYTKYL